MARAEAGLTMVELATRSGVSRDTIRRLEQRSSEPHAGTIRKLAEALGVGVGELLETFDSPKAPRALSAEWALSVSIEKFRRAIQAADTSRLRRLVSELVGDEYTRTREAAIKETFERRQHRIEALSRATEVRDELLGRGEEAPEKGLPPLKRFLDAIGHV